MAIDIERERSLAQAERQRAKMAREHGHGSAALLHQDAAAFHDAVADRAVDLARAEAGGWYPHHR
jgi:hypothetical protein